MLKNILFFCFLFLNSPIAWGQGGDIWKTLAKVQFKTIKKKGLEIDIPVFSAELKQMQGKLVIIKGYLIPLEEFNKQGYFVLSAFPYSNCYFCGGAGIETVLEVYAKEKINYTSRPITLQGVLKLNENNAENLLFILENAILLK